LTLKWFNYAKDGIILPVEKLLETNIMALSDNDRIQEFFLVIGDMIAPVGQIWWYTLLTVVILSVPAYIIMKQVVITVAVNSYHPPQIIYTTPVKEPLQILEKKIFAFPNNTYTGYIRVKNINLEWGVAQQEYTAEFKTFSGDVVTKINGSTFILPASEKFIVFTRFTSQEKPDEINFSLADSHFIHKPEVDFNYDLERVNIQNAADGLTVSAGIKNLTAFTIRTLNLPVIVYDNRNQIVAVNFTYLNDILSGETRTFQYKWPYQIPKALRAEVSPEVNIFDPNVFATESGVSPF
jgi:hypothetical protein